MDVQGGTSLVIKGLRSAGRCLVEDIVLLSALNFEHR